MQSNVISIDSKAAKSAARKQPDNIPEIEASEFDYGIHAGGALTLEQLSSDDPMNLDFTITPAL